MISEVKKLTVTYNGRTVGYLAQIDDEGVFGFQYDHAWLKDGFSISPFSLPLRHEVFSAKSKHFEGLHGVFWDSLPDGWGELLVKRYLGRQGINYERLSPLTKLSLVSENGLGGLRYEPSQFDSSSSQTTDFDRIAEEVNSVLRDEATNLDEVYRLGGSSGGARPKAHISLDGEEWIVKFPCRIDPPNIGEMEYNANVTAALCGIDVNEFCLFPSQRCSGYFGAKRFDRKGGRRIHVISLAALLETTHRTPNLDYGHLFRVVESVCAGKSEMYETFRRMCFNVYYGNKDDHSKNFAFLFDEEKGTYRLSPAYDLTRTEAKFEHEMTINGEGNPKDDDLLALAKEFRLSIAKCKDIMEKIKQFCLMKQENGEVDHR